MLKRHALFSIWLKALWHCARMISHVLFDLVELLRLATKSRSALVAENLFQERDVKPTAPRLRPDG
jgi:hypothetical protein